MPGEAVIASSRKDRRCGPGHRVEKQIGERHVTKRTSAKYKLDRRMGENVFGRPKSPVNRREYGPGQHGQRRKSKVSDYRHPAARQAEAQGLLRRHHREAVQEELSSTPAA